MLERLVVLEEAPQFAQQMAGQLRLVGVIGKRRVAHADRHDLVVDALLVAHAHHADRARLDDGQRIDGLLPEHQRVERIAIVAVGPRDEAVVGGIVHGAVEHAIETEQPRLLVQLVLVLAALGDFDHDREALPTMASST